MQKWGLIVLLCLLLVTGAASDKYQYREGQDAARTITVTAPFNPQYTPNQNPQNSIDLVAKLSGITQFQEKYQTSGNGKKIALIDSGIDLNHAAFQKNADQSAKVAIYQDYTMEGVLYPQAVSCYGGKVAAGGTIYHIGSLSNKASQYRMAFLDLDTVQPKQFPKNKQQLAVLVTASKSDYDCIYIDTNQNCDFTDEQPLHLYNKTFQSVTLHLAGYQFNIALTNIHKNGEQLQLTADTLGHGTFLAGLMAANGVDYQGIAPQAQLCVYKIFDREGQSSQVLLAKAIRQAILDDVDCINLSLSIPKEETINPQLTEVLNQARAANIPVVAAAGNYGPGQDTVAYPARAQTVIGVGSYVAPAMYRLDKDVLLEQTFISDYSGRGKQNGENCPLLVAPAGVVSTVPGWYTESYLYDYGTSISAAVATAAIIHVQEAVEKRGSILSIEQIQNLFTSWAKDIGFTVSEQGYGALQLGTLPKQLHDVKQRKGLKSETVLYDTEDTLNWKFSIPQGQTTSWYVDIPRGTRKFSAVLQIEQQQPLNAQEHLVAMGRCQLSLYDPQGKLVDQTPYLGASYSRELVTSGGVQVKYPQSGVWEIIITSADNLSQYNHFETIGSLLAEVR